MIREGATDRGRGGRPSNRGMRAKINGKFDEIANVWWHSDFPAWPLPFIFSIHICLNLHVKLKIEFTEKKRAVCKSVVHAHGLLARRAETAHCVRGAGSHFPYFGARIFALRCYLLASQARVITGRNGEGEKSITIRPCASISINSFNLNVLLTSSRNISVGVALANARPHVRSRSDGCRRWGDEYVSSQIKY